MSYDIYDFDNLINLQLWILSQVEMIFLDESVIFAESISKV